MEDFTLECSGVVYTEHDDKGSGHTISSLQSEISWLRSKQRSLDGKRREALNKILDIKGSIRVFCRVRPPPSTDRRNVQSPILAVAEKIIVKSVVGAKKEFIADRVFSHGETQEDVFQEVKPILRSALDGHNVCIFAYGQTGTGKTFTMEGRNDQPGIVPRSIEELFRRAASSFAFSMSMLEIYTGSIRDLFTVKHPSCSRMYQSTCKGGLNILSDSNGSVEVEGLTDVSVSDFKQAYRWYAKGKRARATSWTNVNDASSRSHCLTRITIRRSGGDEAIAAKLWMVDLGGSERLLKTGATGQTLDEGKAINLSLSALGDVIASLKKKKRNHIPYRNSKLTQILSDSLGDGSKVLMIVHLSPSEDDVGETICSLGFAKRVRAVEHNRELSEESKNQKVKCIAELDQLIQETEAELQEVRHQIETVEQLIKEKNMQKDSPRSPLIIGHGDVSETPRTEEKGSSRPRNASVPRFMASTAASRQRLSASKHVSPRRRTVRIGSQSLSFSEPGMKPASQRLKSKLVVCETNGHTCCNNSIDSKSSSISRSKKASTSHPSLRAALHHHRRWLSDFS